MASKGTWLTTLALLVALTGCASERTTLPPSSERSEDPPQDAISTSQSEQDAPSAEATPGDTTQAIEFSAVPGRFSKNKAMVHVRALASEIGVRTKASSNETRGARYMKRKLQSFGYEVSMQKFQVPNGTSRNVVARWPGARKYGFVVGAHIDTVPGSPGANDNASGTATVIELARIFADTEQAAFITFVGFGAEEYDSNRISHHDGSEYYVQALGEKGRNRLGGALSVDMIADGRPLLVGHSDIAQKPIVARTVYNKMRKAGFDVKFHILCDCSDHGPFEHAGIPAAFAYSGPEPNYHDPSDTVPNMEPKDLLRTGRAVRAFLLHLDKAMVDRFRRA